MFKTDDLALKVGSHIFGQTDFCSDLYDGAFVANAFAGAGLGYAQIVKGGMFCVTVPLYSSGGGVKTQKYRLLPVVSLKISDIENSIEIR